MEWAVEAAREAIEARYRESGKEIPQLAISISPGETCAWVFMVGIDVRDDDEGYKGCAGQEQVCGHEIIHRLNDGDAGTAIRRVQRAALRALHRALQARRLVNLGLTDEAGD